LEFVWNLGFGYWDFDFMIRVVLPHHLRTLAHVGDEIHVDPNGSATLRAIIDAIEEK
jgi:molybdopterin synthase sulfur carrier subunit